VALPRTAEAEHLGIEGELIDRVTRDAVMVPLFVESHAAVLRSGVTGVKPIAGSPILVSRLLQCLEHSGMGPRVALALC